LAKIQASDFFSWLFGPKNTLPNSNYVLQIIGGDGGSQICPWGCSEGYGGSTMVIYDQTKISEQQAMMAAAATMAVKAPATAALFKDQIKIVPEVAIVNKLYTHLIGKHYFFEGKGSPYRADPEVLINALGLNKR